MKGVLSRHQPGRDTASEQGFSLVEIMVGVVLLAVAASGTMTLITVANRMISLSGNYSNVQAVIDSDISRARKLAEDYTCCPGSCTASGATIETARSTGQCAGNVNDSTYYFPQLQADIPAFATACSQGNLNANLITAINGLGSLSGVTRTVEEDDSSDPVDYRIRITYQGTGNNQVINRVVKLVPTVAGWCP